MSFLTPSGQPGGQPVRQEDLLRLIRSYEKRISDLENWLRNLRLEAVVLSSPPNAAGDVPVWDGSEWIPELGEGIVLKYPPDKKGQVVTWDGTGWIPAFPEDDDSGFLWLAQPPDTPNQIPVFDGSRWFPQELSGGGVHTEERTFIVPGVITTTLSIPPMVISVGNSAWVTYPEPAVASEQAEIIGFNGNLVGSQINSNIYVDWHRVDSNTMTDTVIYSGHRIFNRGSGNGQALDSPVSLTDGDLIYPVVTAVYNSPAGLSAGVVLVKK